MTDETTPPVEPTDAGPTVRTRDRGQPRHRAGGRRRRRRRERASPATSPTRPARPSRPPTEKATPTVREADRPGGRRGGEGGRRRRTDRPPGRRRDRRRRGARSPSGAAGSPPTSARPARAPPTRSATSASKVKATVYRAGRHGGRGRRGCRRRATEAVDSAAKAAERAADERPTTRRDDAAPDRARAGRRRLLPSAGHDRPRPRIYLTTAIAYANNRPGLHTLYEVIGADAIARWHRMVGDETRFLTGTDEHSVNIAQQAAEEGRSPRDVRRREGRAVQGAEAALLIAPDRFIRTTDPDHVRAAQEMVRRAYANGDIYLGTYEGWYCPNEGFRAPSDVQETARGTICPNHPDVPLQWLSEQNWFFRLSAYQERLERHYADHPDFVQPEYRRNEMLGFIRRGLEDFSISRAGAGWGIPFPIAENGETAQREDGSWDPEAGHDLRLVRRADQLHHRGGLPGRSRRVRPVVAGRPPRHRQGHRPVPHDLLAGDALERRARGAAPGLGPRLAPRPGRADEQEPGQLPRPGRGRRRVRGRRRPVRRRCARSRSTATPT